MKLTNFWQNQFIRFTLIGSISVILDILILYVFTDLLSLYYFGSAIFSYTTTAILGFVLQKKYTFRDEGKNYLQEFFTYFVISISGLVITSLIIYFGVEQFKIWYLYCKLLAVIVVWIYSYFANKILTFKKA